MIYTFTLNPSIDYFLKIKGDPVINEVNRGTDTVFKAGGKGLNVSKGYPFKGGRPSGRLYGRFHPQ
ncbi:MAG: hypothetical protein II529_04465 [Erysipelotrichaceae bacterium]|nr:hypothetical protein [Erysipelotrichaceae bacterium]MBQ2582682.1 hypothetical protein [Erysipelotrichaceae bacterium]